MQTSMIGGSADEETNNNTQMHVTKVNSIHGRSLWWCKHCGMSVRVAEHVTGNTKEDDYTIYWNYINGECGHTLKDWSY